MKTPGCVETPVWLKRSGRKTDGGEMTFYCLWQAGAFNDRRPCILNQSSPSARLSPRCSLHLARFVPPQTPLYFSPPARTPLGGFGGGPNITIIYSSPPAHHHPTAPPGPQLLLPAHLPFGCYLYWSLHETVLLSVCARVHKVTSIIMGSHTY